MDELQRSIRKEIDEISSWQEETELPKSKREKDERIKALEEENRKLKMELQIRKSINDRYIRGLMDTKHDQIRKLIKNPILTLPSGEEIMFADLSEEQLSYLEGLAKNNQKRR